MNRLIQLNEYGMGIPSYEEFIHKDDPEARAIRKKAAAIQLHTVINNELTERQKKYIEMYFFKGLNTVQIAQELGVNKSTVSRTIMRAKNRISRSMKYGFERF